MMRGVGKKVAQYYISVSHDHRSYKSSKHLTVFKGIEEQREFRRRMRTFRLIHYTQRINFLHHRRDRSILILRQARYLSQILRVEPVICDQGPS